MFEIVAAHGIPYAATASIGYLNDFMRKVEHAASIRGTKYIHVMAPCPTGWGCGVDETVDISKDIVDCGLWYLAEYEGGVVKLNRNPREFASVEAYLRRQGRFKALTDEDVASVVRRARREMGGHAERLGVARPNIGTSKMKGVVCSGALAFFIFYRIQKQII